MVMPKGLTLTEVSCGKCGGPLRFQTNDVIKLFVNTAVKEKEREIAAYKRTIAYLKSELLSQKNDKS